MNKRIFIGVYDVFSALIASKYSKNIFLSGFGLSASHYGLTDRGYTGWEIMVDHCARIKNVCPNSNLLIDIDDGYGSPELAYQACKRLIQAGAWGFIMEDQSFPKKCGHLPGKQLISSNQYLEKLEAIVNLKELYSIARTDSNDFEDIIFRIKKYIELKPSCILIDGLSDLTFIGKIREIIPSSIDLAINFMNGGITEGKDANVLFKKGIQNIIFSAPCLSSAEESIHNYLDKLEKNNWNISKLQNNSGLTKINSILNL